MPNTVDLAFDIDKFDASKKITYDGLIEIYELTKKISSAPIQIGSTGGWGELKAQASSLRDSVEQLQSSYANLSNVQKNYSQASKDEAKASSDLQKAKLNEAKASKETALASAAEAKASKDNAAAMLLEAKAANELERAKTAANKVPKAPPQSQADYVASVPFTINAAGSEEATKAAEAQGVAINELEAAQIADTIAAKEWANAQLQAAGVSADVNAATADQVTESEALLKAKEALAFAQSEENVQLQGYKLQTQQATLAAKEQAAAGLELGEVEIELATDYEILSKAWTEATLRAKNLSIAAAGINEQWAIRAAENATLDAKALGDELKRLDSTVGQTAKRVGDYNAGVKQVQVVNQGAASAGGGFLNTMSKQRILFLDLGRIATDQAFSLRAIATNFALFGPAVTIGAVAVALLTKAFFSNSQESEKAQEKIKKYNEEVQNIKDNFKDSATINSDALGNTDASAIRAQQLSAVVQDQTKSYRDRNQALNELKEINKQYFGDLSIEKGAVDKVREATEQYTEALVNQAVIKGLEEEITKVGAVYEKQKKIVQDLTQQETDRRNKIADARFSNTQAGKKNADFYLDETDASRKLSVALQEQSRILQPLQKRWDDLKNEIQAATLESLNFKPLKKVGPGAKDTELKDAKDKEYEDDIKREIQLNKDLSKADEIGFSDRMRFRTEAYGKEAELLDADYNRSVQTEKDKLNDVLKYDKASKNQKINAQNEFDSQMQFLDQKRNAESEQLALGLEMDKMIILTSSHAALLDEDKKSNQLFLDQQADFNKKQEDAAQKSADKSQTDIAATRDALLLALDKTRGNTVESERTFQASKLKIEHDYLNASLEINIQYTDEIIRLARLRKEDISKEEAELLKLKKELADNNSQYQKQKSTTDSKTWQTYFDGIASLATKTNGLIKSLVDGAYTKQENAIQDLIKANNDWESAETTRIENSSLSEQDKAAELIQTKDTAEDQDKKLAQEQKDLEIRKARFAKASAIAQIIINTAVAISKVLDDPFQIAIAAGAGAIELATAIATPIPTYADGTENHPGGPAIAGEAGLELVQPKGGLPVLVNKATLFPDLSAGSRVTPLTDQDITQAMHGGAMASMADRVSIMEALNNKASNNAWEVARWQVRETKKALEASTRQQPVNVVIKAPNEKWQKSINKNVFGR